tara:strand:+ start:85 stop:261 length:177 start_codon:yes stop_codon:yes gene_type:complete
MFLKSEIATRERKLYNKDITHNKNSTRKTSQNISDTKELKQWYKIQNSKRGGKARHIY